VKAIATRDEVTVKPLVGPVVAIGNIGGVGRQVMQGDIFGIMKDGGPDAVLGVVKVFGHLGLAIDHDLFAASGFEVDMEHPAIGGQVAAVVQLAFARIRSTVPVSKTPARMRDKT
jgi:hypothetical protein